MQKQKEDEKIRDCELSKLQNLLDTNSFKLKDIANKRKKFRSSFPVSKLSKALKKYKSERIQSEDDLK